jgi:hypothetical protein
MKKTIFINNVAYSIEKLVNESDEMFYDRIIYISKQNIFNQDILNKSIKYIYNKYFDIDY